MKRESSGGVGLAGLLGVAFIVLKLTGFIDWSWWWVTAPFWLPLAVYVGLLLVFGGGALLIALIGIGLTAWDMRRSSRRWP